MASIGNLTGIGTTVFNLQFVPEFIIIGNVLGVAEGYEVETIIRGKSRIVASNRVLYSGLSKFGVGADLGNQLVGTIYQLANGGKGNEQCQIRITSIVAGAPEVFATSTGKNDGTVLAVSTSQVDANSNQEYKVFDKIAVSSTNVLNFQIKFANGWEDRYSPEEVIALMLSQTPAIESASGINSSTLVFDNTSGMYESIRIYAGAVAVPVMIQTTEFL